MKTTQNELGVTIRFERGTIKPHITRAREEGKWVCFQAHHIYGGIYNIGGLGNTPTEAFSEYLSCAELMAD